MAKPYRLYNFPISMLPSIFNERWYGTMKSPYEHENLSWREGLRKYALEFALCYATQRVEPTIEDIEHAIKKCGVSGSSEYTLKIGLPFYKKWQKERSPLTSINCDYFWSLINGGGYFDEPQIIALWMYLALRSIMGRDNEKTTTKDMIFSRMDGKAKPQYHMNTRKNEKVLEISDRLKPWTTRRKFESIKKILIERHGVEFKKGHTHGIVFSFSKRKKGDLQPIGFMPQDPDLPSYQDY